MCDQRRNSFTRFPLHDCVTCLIAGHTVLTGEIASVGEVLTREKELEYIDNIAEDPMCDPAILSQSELLLSYCFFVLHVSTLERVKGKSKMIERHIRGMRLCIVSR